MAFHEVAARLESFTAAAAEIHVSQAAISRHVRQLERELGKELFRRAHRRVELTQEGRALARQLTAAMRQIQSAVAVCRESRVKRLRLSVEPAFAAQWLVPRLGAFTAVHPIIELQLETSDEIRVLGRDAAGSPPPASMVTTAPATNSSPTIRWHPRRRGAGRASCWGWMRWRSATCGRAA